MFDKDSDLFPIKCSSASCLHEFLEPLGRLKSGQEVRCPACKAVQLYRADEFVRRFEQLKKSGHDFFRDFIDLEPPT